MGKNRKASKQTVLPAISMSRSNTISVDPRWDMVFDEIMVGEDATMTIAGRTFKVDQLKMMSSLADYRENVKEFIRQMRTAQINIRARFIETLTNLIWTINGEPHLVSVVLARDIRIRENVWGLLLFIQRQIAPGKPGNSILAVDQRCYEELKNYLGMERTPAPVSVAGMYMMAWTIEDEVAETMRRAYGTSGLGSKTLYFKDAHLPKGLHSWEVHSKPKIAKTEIPTGREFSKLSKTARNKLRDRVLASSRQKKK